MNSREGNVQRERPMSLNRFEFELAPEGKNRALYITHPDEVMRRVVHRVLGNQYSDHPDSIAARSVGAFFQTGHEPDSEEMMIEFWQGDEAAHNMFADYLQEEYRKERERAEAEN